MDNAEEIKREIYLAQMEMQRCGPIHRRDLQRHIKNLKRKLYKAKRG